MTLLPVDVNRSEWDCTLEECAKGDWVHEEGVHEERGHEKRGLATGARPQNPSPLRGEGRVRGERSEGFNENAANKRNRFALRLGMRLLLGLPAGVVERIAAARSAGPFRSLEDLARRARLGRPVLVRLVKADAVRSLDLDRRGIVAGAGRG